ncbi:MAG: hypothetical protein RJB38_877 [Pseudomonadota bacterium]|jgi:hypothetical protein
MIFKSKTFVGWTLMTMVLSTGTLTTAWAKSAESSKETSSVESIFTRFKFGGALFSHLTSNPTNIAAAYGIDVGFESGNGWGLTAGGKLTEDGIVALGTSSTQTSARYFSVTPHYTLKKGAASINAGLGVGILTTIIETFVGSGIPSIQNTSRMAFSPSMDMDIEMNGGLHLNASIQYVISTGGNPSPWIFLPMVGVGWRF